ncbi:MAG: sulfatase [Planctomycetota bacterium]|nr:MAG: sulfatase [Planctomycetota bacterium]
MNIILIQTDQQRRDTLSCYGNEITHTPAIDELAKKGTVFENAFTPSPICAPARAALLTGKLPSHNGILINSESGVPAGRDFKKSYQTYSQCLTEKKYQCHHIGKWHIGTKDTPQDYNFEGVFYPGYGYPSNHEHYLNYLKTLGLDGFILEKEVYSTFKDGEQRALLSAIQTGGKEASVPWYLCNQTLDAIDIGAKSDQPFFVSCNFWGPHVPYIIPEEYADMYDPKDMIKPPSFHDDLKNKPRVQQEMKEYWGVQDLEWEDWAKLTSANYGYISLIDKQVDRILKHLEQLNITEETAIIFTTDHGGMVGSHGLCDKGPYLYDDICRVPLITYLPQQKPEQRINADVYTMDLMPTFIELADGDTPEDIDALSLLPLINGTKEILRDEPMYIEFYGHQVSVMQKLLRTKEWKYIFNGQEFDEYYDLINDPHEMINEINNPNFKSEIQHARDQMTIKLKSLKDPSFRYFHGTRMHEG